MNKVTLIDPLTDPRWDQFVLDHPYGCIGHTSAWKRVLENSFSHMKGYYYAIEDQSSGQIRSALPVYAVKSWLTGNRLVSIPFVTLCDPLVTEKQDLSILLDVVRDTARVEKCKTIEIRSLATKKLLDYSALTCSSEFVTHQIDLKPSLDVIFKHFHKTSIQERIRRAEKRGLKTVMGDSIKHIDSFYELYEATRKRLCLPSHPLTFFREMWKQLSISKNILLILVYKMDILIAGGIFLAFKDRISAEYSGWDRNFARELPNHIRYWETIKRAKNLQFKVFDFGRTHQENYQLLEFKGRWGANKKKIYSYYNIAGIRSSSKKESSMKYACVNKLCRHLSGKGFRLLSNFCYRHLG